LSYFLRQNKNVRQIPEGKALLEAAVMALMDVLPSQLPVKLLDGEMAGRLRIGKTAEFRPVVQPGWRGTVVSGLASELAADEVLVVPYVNEVQGKYLREQGTCYIDRAGNAWLTNAMHALAVMIQGQPRPREALAVAGGQLFSKTGIRLLYTLLAGTRAVSDCRDPNGATSGYSRPTATKPTSSRLPDE
jgi:hypothetical protein